MIFLTLVFLCLTLVFKKGLALFYYDEVKNELRGLTIRIISSKKNPAHRDFVDHRVIAPPLLESQVKFYCVS